MLHWEAQLQKDLGKSIMSLLQSLTTKAAEVCHLSLHCLLPICHSCFFHVYIESAGIHSGGDPSSCCVSTYGPCKRRLLCLYI